MQAQQTVVSASLILSGPCHPAWNMAVDEALLRCAQDEGIPRLIVRFYGWDRPSASMGYFQNYRAAQAVCAGEAAPRFIVRRATGGGMVRHGADWTYSLVYPQNALAGGANDYQFVHGLIQQALQQTMGWSDMAALPEEFGHRGRIAQCFVQPSAFDLMRGSRKIAGAAQKRSKGWMLHQGTVDLAADADAIAGTGMAFARILEKYAGGELSRRDLTPGEEAQAKGLLESRYATEAWNRKF